MYLLFVFTFLYLWGSVYCSITYCWLHDFFSWLYCYYSKQNKSQILTTIFVSRIVMFFVFTFLYLWGSVHCSITFWLAPWFFFSWLYCYYSKQNKSQILTTIFISRIVMLFVFTFLYLWGIGTVRWHVVLLCCLCSSFCTCGALVLFDDMLYCYVVCVHLFVLVGQSVLFDDMLYCYVVCVHLFVLVGQRVLFDDVLAGSTVDISQPFLQV